MKVNKDIKIIFTNYLVLIDSILRQTSLSDNGAIIKLKTDRKIILQYLPMLEERELVFDDE